MYFYDTSAIETSKEVLCIIHKCAMYITIYGSEENCVLYIAIYGSC